MNSPMDQLLDAVEWRELPPPDAAISDGNYATHEAVLTIGDVTLRCYVLNDGRRLIDAGDVNKLLGL